MNKAKWIVSRIVAWNQKLNGEIRRIESTIAYRLLGLGNKYKIIIY